MKKEEFTEFVEQGAFYIASVFSETEAKQYKKNMQILFENEEMTPVLDYLALNYFNEYGKRSEFFHKTLKKLLSGFVDIKVFLKDFNNQLNNTLLLKNLSDYYYEVPSGNIVTRKYVYDNITLLLNHLDFYRVHNHIYVDGNPIFIPTNRKPDKMLIFEYVQFLLDLNSLFEYYTPDELGNIQEQLKTILEIECSFTKQKLKEKIMNLDIKNGDLLAEIRWLLR